MATRMDYPADVIDRMTASWARRDLNGMFAEVAEDVEYISATGKHWRGLDEVRRGWTELMEAGYSIDPIWEEQSQSFLTPDIAVVTQVGRLKDLTLPDGRRLPTARTFATSVLVREGGRWLVKHGHSSTFFADAL